MKNQASFEKTSILRRPDWRWKRVRELLEQFPTPGRCSSRDDHRVRAARKLALTWPTAEDDSALQDLLR